MKRLSQGATALYILLFTSNSGKAEYFSLKLSSYGHTVSRVTILADLHHALRFSDPDFVIVDSETFPEPDHDYRSFIYSFERKFLLFYDNELLSGTPPQQRRQISDEQSACIMHITDALADIRLFRTLSDRQFSVTTPEEQLFLKQNELRPPHALILSCLLKNRDTDIAAATLSTLLWADGDSGHQQTLYAYMNQLRMLLKKRNIPLIIDKRSKGTYRICSIHDSRIGHTTDMG